MNPSSSTEESVSLRARFRSATRDAILDAASDLLRADGAVKTRMEDIALRAGVAVGTVYNYFEDRTALISALLERRTKTLFDALDAAVAAPVSPRRTAAGEKSDPATFETELGRFVSALGTHVNANRFLLSVLFEEESQRGIDAKAATRRRTVLGELLLKAERLMERGIRTKALRKDNPAMYAALLVGMVRGVALSVVTEHAELSAARTASIVRVFLSGAAR